MVSRVQKSKKCWECVSFYYQTELEISGRPRGFWKIAHGGEKFAYRRPAGPPVARLRPEDGKEAPGSQVSRE